MPHDGNGPRRGGSGGDRLDGGDGSDHLIGKKGDDTLDGGPGADRVEGQGGDDTAIYVVEENAGVAGRGDRYDGGQGLDTLRIEMTAVTWARADVRADILRYLAALAEGTGGGSPSQKDFEFTAFNLTARRFEKLQVVVDGQEIDVFLADPGGGTTTVDRSGSTEDESVEMVGDGDTEIATGSGNDTVVTGNGDNSIATGAGNDIVTTGSGNDTVDSGSGDDTVHIGDGDDVAILADGDDTAVAGQGGGDDVIDGGLGSDTVTYPSAATAVTIDLNPIDRSSTFTAGGSTVGDLLTGAGHAPDRPVGLASGADIGTDVLIDIENATGGAGDDTIIGNDNSNTLEGAGGADIMTGGLDADVFKGTLAELDGDRITDLAADDDILVTDSSLAASQLRLTAAGSDTLLEIDGDNDGSFESAITLTGSVHGTIQTQADGSGTRVSIDPPAELSVTYLVETADPDAILRASTGSDGTQGNGSGSGVAAVSGDGRYVAFLSFSDNLVPDDTNGVADVFVKDMLTGTLTRVSTDSSGNEANGGGKTIVGISADGRYAVFASTATNLVADDTNDARDLFVKDLQTGALVRVTADSAGVEGNEGGGKTFAISADGRYVAFDSSSSNLVADDTNSVSDIFVKDMQTGAVTRVSTDADGAEADDHANGPSISADGRYVAFQSGASNLVADDTNGDGDIFVKDLQTGTVMRVSTNESGGEANDGASVGSASIISASGRHVVFHSAADNLVADDTNGASDVFVKDLQTGAVVRVSTEATGGEANGGSSGAAISADGRYVVFRSEASNLVAGDTNGVTDIFIKDLQTGAIARLTTDASGVQANDRSDAPSISADGRYVVFDSNASNLAPNDTNDATDVFKVDVEAALENQEKATAPNAVAFGVTSPGLPSDVIINWGDGDISSLDDVAPETDLVFRHAYEPGLDTTLVITANTESGEQTMEARAQTAPAFFQAERISIDGGVEANHDSFEPAMSGDGRYVAFRSFASNLVPGDTNGHSDIFVMDRLTGDVTRVSTGTGGTQSNHLSREASLSADGRYVAFTSFASNLVAGDTNGLSDVFVKDLQTGATTRISTTSAGTQGNSVSDHPSVSADGRYVAFSSQASNLAFGDNNLEQDIFVKDLQTGALTRVSTDAGGGQANDWNEGPTISADGRYVAFASYATNLVAGDGNDEADIFVKDLQTGAITRTSTDSGGGEANGASLQAAISADGRYVAFLSAASNLVADDTNGAVDLFVKDLATGAVIRIPMPSGQSVEDSGAPAISADGRHVSFATEAGDVFVYDVDTGETFRISSETGGNTEGLAISADGQYVAFASFAANLVAHDQNDNRDVFVVDRQATGSTLDGDETADILIGHDGSDTLRGNGGGDVLKAGAGDDVLEGGADDDFLTGGLGADHFVFRPSDGNDVDTITDFEIGTDGLVFEGGLEITETNEADHDGDGAMDTVIDTSSGDEIVLLNVTGVSDPNNLFTS